MAGGMKTLAKETAIYGVSSILGRFLNWLLTPFWTYVLMDTAQMGVVGNLYSWTALTVVILTYGMETGLFRYNTYQYCFHNVFICCPGHFLFKSHHNHFRK